MSGKRELASTCWECSTLCGTTVTVEHGAVTDIRPVAEHPYSRGAFCVKGKRGAIDSVYGASRLRMPLRRRGERGGGDWEEISWDAALDDVAARLAAVRERHGPLALVGAVSGAFFSRGLVVALLMRSLGSPNWMINQDLCGGCRAVSDMVTGLGIAQGDDVENTQCALIVGRNPAAADPVQWMALRRAKARGACIITIDPKRTPAAELAHIWMQPRPGTDAAIALAMMQVIIAAGRHDATFVRDWCVGFDALATRAAACPPERAEAITGVPAARIIEAAHRYTAGPSAFVSGHGIDAFAGGFQTYRAFHCLLAICGHLDRPGGNRRVKSPPGFRSYLDVLSDPAFRLPAATEEQTIGARDFPLWAGPRGWQKACHNPSVLRAMLTGKPYPVRALYASGVNILVTYPDTERTAAALRSLDCFVVAASTMTPTAEFADIVLPKTVMLEEQDVTLMASAPCLLYSADAVAPVGAKPDIEIAAALLDRMQARGAVTERLLPWRTQRELNTFLLRDTNVTLDELAAKGFHEFPYQYGDYRRTGFKTPSGKIELHSQQLADMGHDPLPGLPEPAWVTDDAFPLILLTGDREKTYHHSRFREQNWARKVSPDPTLMLNPDDAARLGLQDQQWVELSTKAGKGACRLKLRVTDATPLGVVSTGMGWWYPEQAGPFRGARDVNINAALTYEGPYDPVTGSASVRGVPCTLAPAAAPPSQSEHIRPQRVPAADEENAATR